MSLTAEEREIGADFLKRSIADPVFFIEKALGITLWDKQKEIARAVRDHPRVAVRSCKSSGKTFLLACLMLWFTVCFREARVFTTSGSGFRHVRAELWSEAAKAYRASKTPLGGNFLAKSCEWEIAPMWGAMGFATDMPGGWSGFHGMNIFLIVDEASLVEDAMFTQLKGLASSGAKIRQVLLSQGTRPAGAFYDAFHGSSELWRTFWIDGHRDIPNFAPDVLAAWRAAGEPEDWDWPCPWLLLPSYAKEVRIDTGGELSDEYRVHIRGEFAAGDPKALITLDLYELARARELPPYQGPTWLGLDVAYEGEDSSVLYVRRGSTVLFREGKNKQHERVTAAWTAEVIRRFGVSEANIDTTGGYGAGVMEMLAEQVKGVHIHAINFGGAPRDQERYLNKRAEMYGGLKERFSKGNISLVNLSKKDADRLSPELTALRASPSTAGRLQIEPKANFKKRIGHSPDDADALALAFAVPTDSEMPLVAFGGMDMSEVPSSQDLDGEVWE